MVLEAPLERSRGAANIYCSAERLPPLRPDGADEAGVLPRIDTIRAASGLRAAIWRSTRRRSTASASISARISIRSALSRSASRRSTSPARKRSRASSAHRAGIRIRCEGRKAAAALVIEYFNGDRWLALGPDEELDDTPALHGDFKTHGDVAFNAPIGWAESEINGESHHWLRFRLASGDYGRPRELSVRSDPAGSSKYHRHRNAVRRCKPPIVRTLRVGYIVLSNPAPLEYCVAENDFAFVDHSENARWSRSTFAPFMPVGDRAPALHFAFSHRPPPALVSLLLQVIEPAADADAQPFTWEYWSRDGWTELSVRDSTLGLQQTGLIQFVGAAGCATA